MIFDPLYSALDFFLDGDSPQAIIRDGKMVIFKTTNGLNGLIVKTKQGDRKILLGDKVIYIVEKNVFDLVDFKNLEPPPIEIYLPKLILAWHSPLQEKSKNFVQKIIQGISQIVYLNLIEDLNGEIEKIYGVFTFKKN